MAEIRYTPTPGGIASLLLSSQMQAFMADQGAQAARLAASFSPTPGHISSQTVQAFGRWCANVTNNADDAVRQEYGGRRQPPLHPLAHVLDRLWSTDPNRNGPTSARLGR